MPQYNWVKLKRKYMTGNYKSLVDFAQKEKIDYKKLRRNSIGWASEKRAIAKQKESKIQEKIINNQIDRAVTANEKHMELWDKLINIVDNVVSDSESMGKFQGNAPLYKAVSALSSIVSDAQKGQRLALDMDKQNNTSDEKIDEMITLLAEAVNEAKYE